MHLQCCRDSSARAMSVGVPRRRRDTLIARRLGVVAVVWNGYRTGVAVAWAMRHGEAHPATTDRLHTSVGAAAIRGWLRSISYQTVPEESLPVERDGYATVSRRMAGDLLLSASPPGTPRGAS